MKLCIIPAMVAALTATVPQPVAADIIVTPGVSNQDTDNVLLNDATNVAIVTGTIDSGAFTVNFESDGGNLNAEASGQAVVTPAHEPFTDISFYLTDGHLFTKAVFNINSAANGNMLIRVSGVNIDGGEFQAAFPLDDSGQNFYTVSAINLQYISMITLMAQGPVVFEDLRQVRIGGGAQDVTPTPVPEPASMLLLSGGLASYGIAAARRRRKTNS